MRHNSKIAIFTRASQEFCNILVSASFWCVYHVTEVVQGMVGCPLWLVALWLLLWQHVKHCFTPCGIWKPHRWTCNLFFMSANRAITPRKPLKNICYIWKMKVQLITVQQPDSTKNFTRVSRISTIKQCQVSLKQWILRSYSKPQT